MDQTTPPPIHESIMSGPGILSRVWIRFFESLRRAVTDTEEKNTLLQMSTGSGEMAGYPPESPMGNFVPNAPQVSSLQDEEMVNPSMVLASVPASPSHSAGPVDMQTLYWMGV